MNKFVWIMVALALTFFFAVTIWVQAGRFKTTPAVVRSDADASSFTSPYMPVRQLKPIYQKTSRCNGCRLLGWRAREPVF